MRVMFPALAFVVLAGLMAPAYALSVSTDKTSYQAGDTVVVSGTVSEVIERISLLMRITYGNYYIVTDVYVYPFQNAKEGKPVIREDGTWTVHIKPVGPFWNEYDRYNVSAYYNGDVARTSFSLEDTDNVVHDKRRWTVAGTNSIVEFSIKNGRVLDMIYDQNAGSLRIKIDGYTRSNGLLTLLDVPQKLVNVTTPLPISFSIGVYDIVVDSMTKPVRPQVQVQTPSQTQNTMNLQSPYDLQTKEIPAWVRSVFVHWTNGNISDQELINAIEFLVKEGIININ